MTDWIQSIGHALEQFIGWVFSASWLPPTDFQFYRWLVVPGYGYGGLLIAFAAFEFCFPAQRRPWNRASLLSGMYLLFAGKIAFYSLLITPLVQKAWISLRLPSLHLDQSLPLALFMPISILVLTFTAYWAHRLMHRIPALWQFHRVHHATKNLNVTSVYQMHFLEYLVHTPLHLVTVLLLGTDLVAPFGLIFMAVNFLGHANVRLDLGRLAYVLCTPQAHRIHHSIDPKHYDTNFSNTFMLWDHVFGTFHYDPLRLPTEFGVSDELPANILKQQAMPLIAVAKSFNLGFFRTHGRGRENP